MVEVYKSRFTPGLKDGRDVHFELGETVQFKGMGGEIHDVVIDSVRMSHAQLPDDELGYEVLFPDGRHFIRAMQIVGWEGKGILE